MATIEERARQYAANITGGLQLKWTEGDVWNASFNRYVAIATEQYKIDIEHACQAYCKTCMYRKDKCETDWRCDAYADFRKAMEE